MIAICSSDTRYRFGNKTHLLPASMKRCACIIAGLAVLQSGHAAPVVYDVDGVKVIVSRPFDNWSGNKAGAEYSLDCIGQSKIAYFYIAEDGERRSGHKGLWSKPENLEFVANVDALMKTLGYSVGVSGCSVTIGRPVGITTDEVGPFLKAQNTLYRTQVLSQGDPATLTDRITRKRYVATALSFATMGVAADKLSHLGNVGLSMATALGETAGALSAPARRAVVGLPLDNIDLSGYQTIDIRKVQAAVSDRVGQIILAYPGAKDAASENKALARAIITAAGGETTREAVQAARDADYQRRVGLWADCRAAGECKE